jgi:hypothetical protein
VNNVSFSANLNRHGGVCRQPPASEKPATEVTPPNSPAGSLSPISGPRPWRRRLAYQEQEVALTGVSWWGKHVRTLTLAAALYLRDLRWPQFLRPKPHQTLAVSEYPRRGQWNCSWEPDWSGRGARRSKWSRFRHDCHELARALDMRLTPRPKDGCRDPLATA